MKPRLAAVLGRMSSLALALVPARPVGAEPPLRVQTRDLGPLGTGSNMFRRTEKLTKVGAPGEYQLDSMVEAPDGKVFIGTAYGGLVYELDPPTGRIRSLGRPPVDSTPWIFTLVRTRGGEIYGARGVGLFRLDWRTGKMEGCGLVPGDRRTPGPGASNPIVRTLEERPDGLLWGDTNCWIFTFDPKARKITPVADVAAFDDACYGVLHNQGESPLPDLYFHVYSRFSGRTAKHPYAVCRAATGKVEPLAVKGLEGKGWPCGWWDDGGRHRWLVAQHDAERGTSEVALVDLEKQRVAVRWAVPGHEMPPSRLPGPGLWFTAFGPVDRGCFLLPRSRRLVGIAADGTVSVFDAKKEEVTRVRGPAPLPAGPAVHPAQDVWYFADRRVLRCTLDEAR